MAGWTMRSAATWRARIAPTSIAARTMRARRPARGMPRRYSSTTGGDGGERPTKGSYRAEGIGCSCERSNRILQDDARNLLLHEDRLRTRLPSKLLPQVPRHPRLLLQLRLPRVPLQVR